MAMLTTKQAAEKLGVSVRRVNELVNTGRLPSQKFGNAHMIDEKDLSLVADRKVGRPLKSKGESSKAGKKDGK